MLLLTDIYGYSQTSLTCGQLEACRQNSALLVHDLMSLSAMYSIAAMYMNFVPFDTCIVGLFQPSLLAKYKIIHMHYANTEDNRTEIIIFQKDNVLKRQCIKKTAY